MTKYNIETDKKIECFHCKKMLPASPKYFYRKKASKTGYDPKCKVCWGSSYAIHQPNKVLKAKEGFKFCAPCKRELPYEHFTKLQENKDGYNGACKECELKRERVYNADPAVKEARRKYARKWRKEFYSTERGRAMNLKHVNIRRSRKESTVYNYSEEVWKETLEHFNNECAYCGGNKEALHQDHVIPLSKGGYYTRQNIIPSCQFCNSSKHARDLMDWYTTQPYFSEKRLDKILKWTETNESNVQQLQLL